MTRERKCDNPAPQNGGKPCDSKDAKETKNDCNQPCESRLLETETKKGGFKST